MKDYLSGKWDLLRADDVLVSLGTNSSGVVYSVGQTTGENVSNTIVQAVAPGTACDNYLPPQPARLFPGLGRSVAVVAAPTGATCDGGYSLYVQDSLDATQNSKTALPALGVSFFAKAADLDADGYEEIYVLAANRFLVFGAKDPANPAAGLTQVASAAPSINPASEPVVADFDGDGYPEIVFTQGSTDHTTGNAVFYSVCPAAGVEIRGQKCSAAYALIAAGTIDLTVANASVSGLTAVAGKFKGIPSQSQLIAARISDLLMTDLLLFDIDSNFKITFMDAAHDGRAVCNGEVPHLVAGTIDNSGSDHLVYACRLDQIARVYSIGPQMKFANVATIVPPNAIVAGLTIGRFDPLANADGSIDFNSQLAILLGDYDNNSNFVATTVQFYSFANGLGKSTKLANGFQALSPGYQWITAGDTQGRSLRLGPPTKVTINNHIQPSLVLGVPPMHVDYIRDASNLGPSGKPTVFNLTALPSSFNAEFAFSSSASQKSSNTSTTSWSYSLGGSSAQKVVIGNEFASNVTIQAKEAGKSAYDGSSTETNESYNTLTTAASARTGFADHLYFSNSRINIYVYPVLGQKVCPADAPSCTDAQKVQRYIQFVAPDTVQLHDVDATTQEWYQPPHEPGNILSYPWSVALMGTSTDTPAILTQNPAPWRSTDTSATAYSTQWSGGASTGSSVGSAETHSFDFTASISGTLNVGVFTGSVSGEFDYSHSNSLENQSTSLKSLDSSTGIAVNKPAFEGSVAQTYFYSFAGYVWGRSPTDSFDNKTVIDPNSGKPLDIQAAGPLRVAFLADPTASAAATGNGAPWWQQAYAKPDVGVGHAARWNWSTTPEGQDVVTFNSRKASEPAEDDPFFHMRGLFVQAAGSPQNSPQLMTASAGDALQLTVRVFNYSLADMSQGTSVKARFYCQRYENGQLQGTSTLIGEHASGPIPGFNSVSNQGASPNYAYITVPFDTTPYSDQHLVFWVVVWMENASGMVGEIEGHGLRNSPANATYRQITDVAFEPYSNNVGMFGVYTPFYVSAKSEAVAVHYGHIGPEGIVLDTPDTLRRGERAKIHVTVRNPTPFPFEAVAVQLYEGDPAAGGTLIDVQRIPRLRASRTHSMRMFYQPRSIGNKTLYVVVGNVAADPAHQARIVRVR